MLQGAWHVPRLAFPAPFGPWALSALGTSWPLEDPKCPPLNSRRRREGREIDGNEDEEDGEDASARDEHRRVFVGAARC